MKETSIKKRGAQNNLKSIETDTGFNVVCACCTEYKSRNVCTGVQVLSQNKQDIYLVPDMKSKDRKTYVCRPCRKSIDANERPKKSERNRYENSNFPTFLKNHLKKVIKSIPNSKENSKYNALLQQMKMKQSLQLNKLESHLLKLVIPFIRVAHCTRGTYIKVKGSLILMSSDISHSMSKILPVAQHLIPVCLKRRLDYTGNYMEEIIDKNKVNAYFNFFKRYNPLFKDIELKESRIDQYEYESVVAAEQFDDEANKLDSEKNISPEEDEAPEKDSDSDSSTASSEGGFDANLNTYFNPEIEKQNEEIKYFRDESSVFCNKYEEDLQSQTIANRLASLIVEAEMHYNVSFEDEIEKEEIEESNLCSSESEAEAEEMVLEDEFLNEEDFFQDILECDAEKISNLSKSNFNNTLNKVSKIPVAPGEKGKFQNWGEDVFLEEKCFPEIFPFGFGGYLSSLVNNKENDMGFANYVKHRILSYDPKYRKNSAYVFFLLIVKELVNIKQCKQTYLRQATKLPHLTKVTIKNLKPEDLSRYNRSYQVFKTMRGTSMYYEEAKKNVMAILRQKGSPSLFVTLSCAGYSWDGLLKEIMETVYNKQFTLEEVQQLTPQEKKKTDIRKCNPIYITFPEKD